MTLSSQLMKFLLKLSIFLVLVCYPQEDIDLKAQGQYALSCVFYMSIQSSVLKYIIPYHNMYIWPNVAAN